MGESRLYFHSFRVNRINTAPTMEYLNKHGTCFVYAVLICNKAFKLFITLPVEYIRHVVYYYYYYYRLYLQIIQGGKKN